MWINRDIDIYSDYFLFGLVKIWMIHSTKSDFVHLFWFDVVNNVGITFVGVGHRLSVVLSSIFIGFIQWRHNWQHGVSNHQPYDCLLNRLFRRRSKKTSKLRVTGLCEGNSPVTGEFPAQRDSTAQMFPFVHHVKWVSVKWVCSLWFLHLVFNHLSINFWYRTSIHTSRDEPCDQMLKPISYQKSLHSLTHTGIIKLLMIQKNNRWHLSGRD